MFAVGALDAYFSDAYTDVVAATAISKSRQPNIVLPEWVYEIKVPIRAVLEDYSYSNWRWRMAARKMMERENVIRLSTIQDLFNKFFRKKHRFFNDLLHGWMIHPDAKSRLFDISNAAYAALTEPAKQLARERAMDQFAERFRDIFQRRHDCIHNCDRPRMAPQALGNSGTVIRVIQDIDFLIHRCDEHINSEFREFLLNAGCAPTTIAQSGY